MIPLERIAFIGTHLPRRCGIATFTHDLHLAIATARPALETCVVAMTDPGRYYDYPPAVQFEVHDETSADYVGAADFLNRGKFDAISLQHEYGIFGGEAGKSIIVLLSRLEMPIVTTLHTILSEPSPAQSEVMRRLIEVSSQLVVMSPKGRDLLCAVHGVSREKIEIIPHGIPDFPFIEPHDAKEKLGFGGKEIVLTFGLLSPSKGIKTVIDAMPRIVKACPNALYVILGATHPHLVRDEGEVYRQSLAARVQQLGIEDHVVFVDRFVDQATLLDFISMCDVYVTPYLNEAQMTSGTLAYSFGLGKAVVSTPYWHAKELLGDGRGILVPFGDVGAIGAEISGLLTNKTRRQTMRKRAYADSRSMTWAQTAERYLSCFDAVRGHPRSSIILPIDKRRFRDRPDELPELNIGHLLSLCDCTGMLQHAVHCVADRAHGYCVDDNARALLLSSALARTGESRLPEILTARFAGFVQHAWNPDKGRFRNFMSYDRRWLEDEGSEDSHGRTLWALAECARNDTDPSRRRWAAALFLTALPVIEDFTSPRAWSFTLLALNAYCPLTAGGRSGNRLRKILAERLLNLLSETESIEWVWFEDVLGYDNARLPQALIQTGLAIDEPSYVKAGLRSLRWLMLQQTAPNGCFRPVGTASFGRPRQIPEVFDQQPLEAAATISACLIAAHAEPLAAWPEAARRTLDWFLGENDLETSLIDPVSGSCSDGLHPDRRNENMGAESALSYLLGLLEVRELQRTSSLNHSRSVSISTRSGATSVAHPPSTPGGHLVSIPILKPAELASPARSGQGRRQTLQAGD